MQLSCFPPLGCRNCAYLHDLFVHLFGGWKGMKLVGGATLLGNETLLPLLRYLPFAGRMSYKQNAWELIVLVYA